MAASTVEPPFQGRARPRGALVCYPTKPDARTPGLYHDWRAAQITRRGTVVVGTGSSTPPWHFEDAEGQLVGMDVEMGHMLANALFGPLTAAWERTTGIISGVFAPVAQLIHRWLVVLVGAIRLFGRAWNWVLETVAKILGPVAGLLKRYLAEPVSKALDPAEFDGAQAECRQTGRWVTLRYPAEHGLCFVGASPLQEQAAEGMRTWNEMSASAAMVEAFDIHEPHRVLEIVAMSTVETPGGHPAAPGISWEEMGASAVKDRFCEFLVPSGFVDNAWLDPSRVELLERLRALPTPKDAMASLADKCGGTSNAPRAARLYAKVLWNAGDKAGAAGTRRGRPIRVSRRRLAGQSAADFDAP